MLGPPDNPPPRKHYFWIDWLRFLAAFEVLLCHARIGNWVEWDRYEPSARSTPVFLLFALTRLGVEAVVIFFVLSGFLVGGKAMERILQGGFDLGSYVLERVTRIYVPLVPALLLSWAASAGGGQPATPGDFLGNLTGLQGVVCDVFCGNDPLWSLSYETWFYALAAFTGLLFSGCRKWAPFAGMVGALLIFTKLNPQYLFCWWIGAAAYFVRSRGLALGLAATAVILAMIAGSQLAQQHSGAPAAGWRQHLPGLGFCTVSLGAGVALLLPCLIAAEPRAAWAKCLEGWGARLASFSYTLYLTHHPILGLWTRFGPGRFARVDPTSTLFLLVKVASCLASAVALYALFEARTQTVRRWCQRRFPRLAPKRA